MSKYILVPVLLFVMFTMRSQTTDIARVEYMHIPFSNSNNSVGRFRALLQVPIPLDKELNNILVAGFEYRNTHIDIKDAVPDGFNVQDVSTLHRISAYAGYVWRFKENWVFGVKAGARINSNIAGTLVPDDWIYTASVYAINDRKKNNIFKDQKDNYGHHSAFSSIIDTIKNHTSIRSCDVKKVIKIPSWKKDF